MPNNKKQTCRIELRMLDSSSMMNTNLTTLHRISFVAFSALALILSGCSSREWDDSPLIRKLKHWKEPVVAMIGDSPIFRSDLVTTYRGLPKDQQEAMQKDNDTNGLIQLTINQFLWRKVAMERGALKSGDYKAKLEAAESELAESWVTDELMNHELSVSEAEIQDFGRQDPKSIAESHFLTFRVDRYSKPKSRKKSPVLLRISDQSSNYYAGIPNPPPLDFVAGLSLNNPSEFVPCGHDLCRYTKLGDVITSPRGLQASHQLTLQKKAKWLNSYGDRQGVKIEKKVDLNDIFQR
jgi:hypothetical protein